MTTRRISIQLPLELVTLGRLLQAIDAEFPGAKWVNQGNTDHFEVEVETDGV